MTYPFHRSHKHGSLEKGMMMTKRRIGGVLVALVLCALHAACGGRTTADGDADTDGDADGDMDVEADGDGDADTDGDADGDIDLDSDHSRDGDVGSDADLATCRDIAIGFRRALVEVNHCDEDHECVAHDFDAPAIADCYTAIRDDADPSDLEHLAEQWRSNDCDPREYRCEPEPPSEVVCTLVHRCLLMGEEYDQCMELRLAFAAEAERINHCEDVSDCVIVEVLDCGIMNACWIPIHSGEDQTELRRIERDYGTVHCPYATCSCVMGELECQDGRCVEIYD